MNNLVKFVSGVLFKKALNYRFMKLEKLTVEEFLFWWIQVFFRIHKFMIILR